MPNTCTPRGRYYALDIETEGLDPTEHKITTVAMYGNGASMVIEDSDEAFLIQAGLDWLESQAPSTIVTWNGSCFDGPFLYLRSNGVGFGVKQLRSDGLLRSSIVNLNQNESIVPKYGPLAEFGQFGYDLDFCEGQHGHVDLAYAFKDWAEVNGVIWSLKPVARAMGLKVIEVDREQMESLSVAERMAYNLSDVVATYDLAVLAEQMGLIRPDRQLCSV